jgi:hypothetical protein
MDLRKADRLGCLPMRSPSLISIQVRKRKIKSPKAKISAVLRLLWRWKRSLKVRSNTNSKLRNSDFSTHKPTKKMKKT